MDMGIRGKTAVVTGGAGAIGSAISRSLVKEGVRVALWDIAGEMETRSSEAMAAEGGEAIAVSCDVTDRESISLALQTTLEQFGSVDILVSVAGGSMPAATTSHTQNLFDLPAVSMKTAFDLNYFGAVLCSQMVGRLFAEQSAGTIVHISSVAGIRPLTRAVSYSDAKSALISYTKWLAVHMALEYSPKIRVNAVAPGFIVTDQNRFLLLDEATGKLTARGESVLSQVPFGRFGSPEEICGAVLWLVSNHASFVTGAVILVDGGFTSFAGV